MSPSIGRIVHYRLPEAFGADAWRPAIVVNGPFQDGRANLTVFLDGLNDLRSGECVAALAKLGSPVIGPTTIPIGSAAEGSAAGCWRWPPKV